jgi:membrane protein implicated in regulation of membrane protease activity
MRPVFLRASACLLIFGAGAVVLAPARGWQVALALSAIIAVTLNTYWRGRQLRRLHREWREAVARERRLPTDGED